MKISNIVLISSASAGRADKCNNIISFLETQGVSGENRVHRRINEFKEDLFPIVKERGEFCGAEDVNERVDLQELDDVEQRMTFDNVENKIQVCFDLWEEYINRKLPADACPNLNLKAKRKLRKFTYQLKKGSERAQERASSMFRKGGKIKLTDEEKAVRDENRDAKQNKKSEKQERKQTRLAVKDANETERSMKKSKKKSKQEKKQDSQDKKAQKKNKKENKKEKSKKEDKPAKEEAVVEDKIVSDEPIVVEATVVEPVAYEYVYEAADNSEVVEDIPTEASVISAVDETADESSNKKKKEGGKKKGKKNKEE
ncbi:unnamed protein product [Oikopleura dioica]|uniref:Uncharacterized protein n=1 Tax=Oikopleura dioica TaxID=34765 RepID=E4XN08_OIKDI|nr:unnamed protein product [Oikopleura dioica]